MEQPVDRSWSCFRSQLLSYALLALVIHYCNGARPTAESEHANYKSSLFAARVAQLGSLIAEPASVGGAGVHGNTTISSSISDADHALRRALSLNPTKRERALDPFAFHDDEDDLEMSEEHLAKKPRLTQKEVAARHGIEIGDHPKSSKNIVLRDSSRLNANVPVALHAEDDHDHDDEELDPEKYRKLQDENGGRGFKGQLANFFHRTIAQERDEDVGDVLQDALEGRVDVMQDHVHDMERLGHASHAALHDYQNNIDETENYMMMLDNKLDTLNGQRIQHYSQQETDRMAPFNKINPEQMRPPNGRGTPSIPVELHVRGSMNLQPSVHGNTQPLTGNLTGEISDVDHSARLNVGNQDHRNNPFGNQEHREDHSESPFGNQDHRNNPFGNQDLAEPELVDDQDSTPRGSFQQLPNENNIDDDNWEPND